VTQQSPPAERFRFLARVLRKECEHLAGTDRRLFAAPFNDDMVSAMERDPILAERVDAFVSRFSRLQDSLGDKLLPLLLDALGERPGAVIDNLDRAERLGLIESADHWLAMRKLRNQMVHEYIEDNAVLVNALRAGHEFVPTLIATAGRILSEIDRRGWM
jgi:uncharacterized protein YutE (UPF0331/DUF86 family)